MLTRCPHCQTHFRVTAEQLKIRQGKVRCGACQDVFDALESLCDEALVARLESPAMPDLTTVAANEASGPDESAPSPGLEGESVAEIRTESESAPEPEREPEPEPDPEPVEPAEPVAEDLESVPATPPAPRRWPWVTGIVALLLVTSGQLAYIFRTELVVLSPELRPALMAGCELVGCTLPRPLKPELLGIEASDLAPAGDGLLLTATLKSRAPFDMDFPHLELTLTDTQDAALVRKVLAPADYLPAGIDVTQGFAARGELAIRLALATDQVPAVGYRLYLFYP